MLYGLWRMNRDYLLLHGRNVVMEHEGVRIKGGFYTGRLVDATNPMQAEQIAINHIWETSDLRTVSLNQKDDPVTIEVEEIEVADGDNRDIGGMAYYIETDEEEINE